MTPRSNSFQYVWGTTAAEREAPFPCDRFLPDADEAYFRAADVNAPPSCLFRWLCQLGVAPYSYDWIDNPGLQSPRTLTPGLDELMIGQRVMAIFRLVEFEPSRHCDFVEELLVAEREARINPTTMPDRKEIMARAPFASFIRAANDNLPRHALDQEACSIVLMADMDGHPRWKFRSAYGLTALGADRLDPDAALSSDTGPPASA